MLVMQNNSINEVMVSVPRIENDNVSIKLATWNCDGLKSGIDYATSLAVAPFLCMSWPSEAFERGGGDLNREVWHNKC